MPTSSALRADPASANGRTITSAVLGSGVLAGRIAEALTAYGTVGTAPSAGDTMLVTATDRWDVSNHHRTRRMAARLAVPWLPVRAELGRVVIGPLEVAGTPGCDRCMQLRRRRAGADPDVVDAIASQYGAILAKRPSELLTTLASDSVAALVADEVRRVVTAELPRTRHAVLYVDLVQLTVSRHQFLPEPLCPECGELPEDRPELAEIELALRPKLAPEIHRFRPVLDELEQLRATYVDAELGLISAVTRGSQAGLVVAAALMRLRAHGSRVEPGIGRTRGYRSSELIGILEALERYGGAQPGGRRTAVRESYGELAGRALDPRTLGVHPPESYRLPDFPYRPFDEAAICNWVWGYSFQRRAPVLVPETVAYYHTSRGSAHERPFCYEISNGCALGSCLEEAILHGVLEVAERDAFLITWYGQLAVPRIDLGSARDRAIPLQAAAIRAETGFEPIVFDTTMEHGVPSVWAMAVSQDGSGAGPRLVCAAGASLDPQRAILSALSELGPIVYDLVRRYSSEAERARELVTNPHQVLTMQDHSTLYAAPEASQRLDFLLDSTRVRRIPEMSPDFRHASLSDDLRAVLDRFIAAGMDVVAVDQTTPEHRAGGFACVKVLVPGSVPMTFGYRNRRIDGIPRLYRVPHLLGYRPRPLGHDELNPHPHPFP